MAWEETQCILKNSYGGQLWPFLWKHTTSHRDTQPESPYLSRWASQLTPDGFFCSAALDVEAL